VQKEVTVGNITIGRRPFVFIGGPCVIEGRDITLRTAETIAGITRRLGLPFIFKSSYDKANRTSIAGFRGPGIDEGLSILEEVKTKIGVPVLTDVHSAVEAAAAAAVVDVLQVPALLSAQTDILTACGRTGRAVNIKKGQFLSPATCASIRKVESTGNTNLMVTERGTLSDIMPWSTIFGPSPLCGISAIPLCSMQPTAFSSLGLRPFRRGKPLHRAPCPGGCGCRRGRNIHGSPSRSESGPVRRRELLALDQLVPVLKTLKQSRRPWTS